jgi:hypothetical protein
MTVEPELSDIIENAAFSFIESTSEQQHAQQLKDGLMILERGEARIRGSLMVVNELLEAKFKGTKIL